MLSQKAKKLEIASDEKITYLGLGNHRIWNPNLEGNSWSGEECQSLRWSPEVKKEKEDIVLKIKVI